MGLLRAGLLAAVVAVAVVPTASAQRPPRLILESNAGSHWAAQESFCVTKRTGDEGVTVCADTIDVRPPRFLRAAPRELLTIRLRRSKIVHEDPSCHPACDASIDIYRLVRGKKRFVRSVDLTQSPQRWRAPRRPGRYEIEVGITLFRAADGRYGDTSGTFGLRVIRGSA